MWNRNSDTMFLPHAYESETGRFRPILDGVRSSRFYQALGNEQHSADEQYTDSWDRFFNKAKMLHESGADMTDDYIVDNDFWDMRIKQRTEDGYFALADKFA
ncbi:MAG: hypothetical protein IJ874_06805 [Ruminococcus sp.]|nr:hypothetical protein [Ruminococcus sp.]